MEHLRATFQHDAFVNIINQLVTSVLDQKIPNIGNRIQKKTLYQPVFYYYVRNAEATIKNDLISHKALK